MKPTRVLIADPCPILREGLAALVRGQGSDWEVCALSAPGRLAAEKAAALRPDVVILGHGHAGGDELATAREIKKASRRTEVLLFSVARSPHALAPIFFSGVAGVLLQSEAASEMLLALETVRRHHRFRSCALLALYAPAEGEVAVSAGRFLTSREMETLLFLCEGFCLREVATRLGVSPKTIDTHRTNLRKKLNLHKIAELIRFAVREGLIEP